MRAAVFFGGGQPLAVEERPIPALGPHDLLVKVERCGICGSEVHNAAGTGPGVAGGTVMGHEYAGIVVDRGSAAHRFALGQRVAVYPAVGCGRCRACIGGNAILCPSATWVAGGYAQYARVPEAAAEPVPDGLDAARAALIEPLAVGLYGLRAAGIAPGDRVLILGGGSIALAVACWARWLGAAAVVMLGRSDRRATMARALGVDAFVTSGPDEVEQVRAALGGPADLVAECVGAPGMLQRAVDHCGTLGRITSLGLGGVPDAIVPAMAGMRGLTVHFPVGYPRQDFAFVARTIRKLPVDPAAMITSVVSLDQVPARFAALAGAHGETKVQIAP